MKTLQNISYFINYYEPQYTFTMDSVKNLKLS